MQACSHSLVDGSFQPSQSPANTNGESSFIPIAYGILPPVTSSKSKPDHFLSIYSATNFNRAIVSMDGRDYNRNRSPAPALDRSEPTYAIRNCNATSIVTEPHRVLSPTSIGNCSGRRQEQLTGKPISTSRSVINAVA